MPSKVIPLLNSTLWQDCEQQYAHNPQRYLSLQDNYDVNVNLLLLAEYLDENRLSLTLTQWQSLSAAIDKWNDQVLRPYRKLRKIAKRHSTEDEYQQMLDVELIMERKAQRIVLHQLNQLDIKIDDNSKQNTASYLSLFGISDTLSMQPIRLG